MSKPLIALTMGDVSGIGPEVIARACGNNSVCEISQPIVVGHPDILSRALKLIGSEKTIVQIESPADIGSIESRESDLLCWNPGNANAPSVEPGKIAPQAGQAAYDYLTATAHAALVGQIDGITTAPLNKAALRKAGLNYPGHTEILAEVCRVKQFAMMLYLPVGEIVHAPNGLGVAHVTLHTSIRSVPDLLSEEKILETIELIHAFMCEMGCPQPRIGVSALNPHAGETGLFGDEETRLIAPAVARAEQSNINATGPFPADTLFRRAVQGEFDGVAAMYHDQGHIAFKLIGFDRAVNVTLGLPIVRTSPSHGTAFDIAWQGKADPAGMIEAIRVAAQLATQKRKTL